MVVTMPKDPVPYKKSCKIPNHFLPFVIDRTSLTALITSVVSEEQTRIVVNGIS